MDISINGAKILKVFEDVPLLGDVRITQTVAMSWLLMILISALCVWLGSGLKVTGISRRQAVAEMAVTSLVKFVHNNMGTGFDRYIPLVGTIFVTSVVSNTISVLGFWSPTADLMTELGWALVVFVLITYHKIKAAGFGAYLKGFLDPLFILAPINVMAECFTPISMACRHFGNILSGVVINGLIYAALAVASSALLGLIPGAVGDFLSHIPILSVGIPAILSFYFDWFSGAMQAFIFTMLTIMYIANAAQG
jgi:F-type H+-transporting ATPase subunit a